MNICVGRFRKPLLYPSELRGHGAAIVFVPSELRKSREVMREHANRLAATVTATEVTRYNRDLKELCDVRGYILPVSRIASCRTASSLSRA